MPKTDSCVSSYDLLWPQNTHPVTWELSGKSCSCITIWFLQYIVIILLTVLVTNIAVYHTCGVFYAADVMQRVVVFSKHS